MRLISCWCAISFLLGSAALAQQSPSPQAGPPPADSPPPLASPPPVRSPAASPQGSPSPAKGGYTGAYTAPSDPKPYSTGPLPGVDNGPGLNVAGPNDTTKKVKAVPCKATAQETDGTTTCIGIPDKPAKSR